MKGVNEMIKESGIQGKYLEYNGKPLVRFHNELYYGDMADKYYLFMMIMSEKTDAKLNVQVPAQILVQILPTDGSNSVKKQKMVNSLSEAFDLGIAWLERENRV